MINVNREYVKARMKKLGLLTTYQLHKKCKEFGVIAPETLYRFLNDSNEIINLRGDKLLILLAALDLEIVEKSNESKIIDRCDQALKHYEAIDDRK